MTPIRALVRATALTLFAVMGGTARAEVSELQIAQQYGINYLQLTVMQEAGLVEKHAKAAGLGDLKVNWVTVSNGAAMNDLLIGGRLHVASGGVGPIITLWAKTKGSLDVKAIASLNSMPVVLNTRNPSVRSVADLTDSDKIALPAVKVSIQAVTLQMAAAKAFGDANYAQLDRLTVSMSHPDGMTALVSGVAGITGHFTGPPFNRLELQTPGIRTVVHSYELLGGKTTSTLVWGTSKFRDENPKTYAAFVAALKEATEIINADKRAAAELYVRATKSKESAEDIRAILTDPDIEYTMAPANVLKYADFMYRTGSIKVKPASWTDMFFPEVHGLPGS